MSATPAFIGRFRVIRPLGQGGMGTLYLAEDQRLERPVAIKLLKEDSEELRERFLREARTAGRLRHVNIVSIFDADEVDGQPFIAMEYIPGETLAEMVRRHAPLDLVRKLQMMEDLCSGLAFAHRAGIIHRDIKPANIMVDSEGTLKILDFGIARLGASGMTRADVVMGTLNYMSPEQIAGRTLDQRSDIFAVGALFYELLTYRQAFPGSLPEVLGRILHQEPQPIQSLIGAVDDALPPILARALAKDPADRYQDLAAMRREILPMRLRLEAASPPAVTIVIGGGGTTIIQPKGAHDSAAQLAALLDSARAALDALDFPAAHTAAADALKLDATSTEASALVAAIAERIAGQARERVANVRELLVQGEITQAQSTLARVRQDTPDLPDLQALDAELSRANAARERQRARAAAAEGSLETAKRQFSSGAFESAVRVLDEVFAFDPEHPEGRALLDDVHAAIAAREARALDERATRAVEEAERTFAEGRRREAVDALERFTPPHPAVADATARLARAASAAEEEEQRARAEAERVEQARLATEREERERSERVAREAAARAKEEADALERTRLAALAAREQEEQKARDLAEAERKEQARLAAEREERERAERVAREAEALAAREKEAAEQARLAEAAREKADADARLAAIREQETRDAEAEAAREKAERDKAARDNADRETAAREKAERDTAAREKAARDKAEQERTERDARARADEARKAAAQKQRDEAHAAASRKREEDAKREATRVEAARVEAERQARLADPGETIRLDTSAVLAKSVAKGGAAGAQEGARSTAASNEASAASSGTLSGTSSGTSSGTPSGAASRSPLLAAAAVAAVLVLAVGGFLWTRNSASAPSPSTAVSSSAPAPTPSAAPIATTSGAAPAPNAASVPAPSGGASTSATGDATPPPSQSAATGATAPIPLAVDAVPWARTRIHAVSPGLTVKDTEQTTPFVVYLPPGTYALEFRSEQWGSKDVQVKVGAGESNRVSVTMPAYDPSKVLSSILGPLQ